MNIIQNSTEVNLPHVLGQGAALTMSSREIADMCETRHNQVAETIERLMNNGVLRESRKTTRRVRPEGGGRPMNVYDLTKRDTLIVVSGYNDEVRARIIDRWIELEGNGMQAAPMSEDQMILVSMQTLVGRVEALQVENHNKDVLIGEMQPKVEEYDAYLDTEGVVTIRDFCNKHQVKVRHPGWALRERGMLHQKRTLATQKGIKSGIIKNIVDRNSFEYIDARGNAVEAQSAMVVKQKEAVLLRMIVTDYGKTAFRNEVAYARAANALKSEGGVA